MWNAKEFGRRLFHARLRRQLTQQDLQEAAGVSERAIRYLEHGQGTPSVLTIYKLADALGIAPKQLLPDVS